MEETLLKQPKVESQYIVKLFLSNKLTFLDNRHGAVSWLFCMADIKCKMDPLFTQRVAVPLQDTSLLGKPT